jgi:hypothetical protein
MTLRWCPECWEPIKTQHWPFHFHVAGYDLGPYHVPEYFASVPTSPWVIHTADAADEYPPYAAPYSFARWEMPPVTRESYPYERLIRRFEDMIKLADRICNDDHIIRSEN